MTEPTVELYAASCNPPRKAKRLPTTSSLSTSNSPEVAGSLPTPIQPVARKSAAKHNPSYESAPADPPAPTPAKRGRKPGPLSRSVREAQRRLNHSIIEKARRTKINDALATLRELVPLDYGQPKTPILAAVDSDAEEDPDDYQPPSGKSSKPGKKQEKEKEFKLEILIRTVAYMKDLITRVGELETEVARSSSSKECKPEPPSRKRRLSQVDGDAAEALPGHNRPRRDSYVRSQGSNERVSFASKSPPVHHGTLEGPLPSISSWLPESDMESRFPTREGHATGDISSYLPSPPSSTHFVPIRTSYHPPNLSLGPLGYSPSMSSSSLRPQRTPEDETAATLLIQMSTSPAFQPLSQGYSVKHSPDECGHALPDPSKMTLSPRLSTSPTSPTHRSGSPPFHGCGRHQAQTPASLLGLTHLLKQN